ncbi:hypothetical protein [Candidatus Viridilinea mediisalina]|uniref:DUF4350 domain-containing protein n=1 Tax=Candidatus Viridilinea mediisalina TaxID=2024553 RepID=A0A2A6RIJ7_9CHLR|nr:hypothetical protein [Candidatus Viridilinea mediisalina]PDW02763.1 hypothetical protein CJ255_12395 [Candidatus Viridilinea mediisalina]
MKLARPVACLAALALCLMLLVGGLGPTAVYAQNQPPPVSLEVRVGYDGAGRFRVNHWFPTEIIATNDGPDLRGTIEWHVRGMAEPAFSAPLDLPRGAHKALQMPLLIPSNVRQATLVLMVDGVDLLAQQVPLLPLLSDLVLVGVISSDQSLLNSLHTVQFAHQLATRVISLDQALLPDHGQMLSGLDVIFIHELSLGELRPTQREALELWVDMGGRLVVGGGHAGALASANLAHLLPVEVGALRPNVELQALEQVLDPALVASSVGSATAHAVRLRPGAHSHDQAQLVTQIEHGAGYVIFTAFDLAATRAWLHEAQFWTEILTIEPRIELASSFRWRSDDLLRNALNLAATRLPSTGLLLLLMATYIIIVGPLNFWLLRRRRRLEWAWVTTPLIVVFFLVAAYGSSLLLRGTNAQVHQLAIVQGVAGNSVGQRTTFLNIYSPQRRSYDITFASDSLVSPMSFEGWRSQNLTLHQHELNVGFENLLIDVSALRTLLIEAPVTTLPQVSSRLERDALHVSGEVQLEGSTGLRDVLIVKGTNAQLLGNLEPGQTATVDLMLNQSNFPGPIGNRLNDDGLIRRSRVLSQIFDHDRFALGGGQFGGARRGIPNDAVYLMGWTTEPGASIVINGRTVAPQSETLYMIRLNFSNESV